MTSWRGLARPSGTTAQASPQISLAPPAPNRSESAERQLARRAVGLGVASFHRLDRQAIADAPAGDRRRLEQRRQGRRSNARELDAKCFRFGEQTPHPSCT